MKFLPYIAITAALAAPFAASPQTATTPGGPAAAVKTPSASADIQRGYAAVKANILKSADKMPADAFPFKPTPEVRTFARVVNHISEAQLNSCGALNKTAPADRYKVPPETADKAAIVAALQASFAECDKAYGTLTDTNLMDTFTVGTATRIRVSIAWGNVSHDNEQYATLALYMRLKGLVPPSSEK
jgi:hypothetical protein